MTLLYNISRFFARHKQLASPHLRQGTAAVETAVVLPLLVLLILGAVEMGQAIMVQQALIAASRAGARVYAVIDETTEQDVRDIVDAAMAKANISGYSLDENPPFAQRSAVGLLEPVTISVSVPYGQVAFLPGVWFLSDTILTGSCTRVGVTNTSTLSNTAAIAFLTSVS